MISWRRKRQLTILTGLLIVAGAIFFIFFYDSISEAPTCFDSKQNGSETGVDCGGVCDACDASATIYANNLLIGVDRYRVQ